MTLDERIARIQLLLLDVDGVLTDGGMYYGDQGEALKRFDVKDGHGIVMWRVSGKRTGILSARNSEITAKRAAELKIDPVLQAQRDKRLGFAHACEVTGLAPEQIAYIGDDTNDLAPLELCGLAFVPSDGAEEAKAVAHHVLRAPGGRGAVREAIELMIKSRGVWDQVIAVMRAGTFPPPVIGH